MLFIQCYSDLWFVKHGLSKNAIKCDGNKNIGIVNSIKSVSETIRKKISPNRMC